MNLILVFGKYMMKMANLIETIDKDAPYKNYPWEKVEKFVKEELKLDLFDKKSLYQSLFE